MPSTPSSTAPETDHRTLAGSNYGDVVPASPQHDPSKGAELERDAMPPTADFSKPLPHGADASGPASADGNTGREERIRRAAYDRYSRRGHADGTAESDWFEAEAAVDAEDGAGSNGGPSVER